MTAPMTKLVIESALRGLLFAAVVGAGLSVLRVKHVPARKAAWSLVLVAAMAMPFLMCWPALAGWQGKLAWAVPLRFAALAQRVAPPSAPATAPAPKVFSAAESSSPVATDAKLGEAQAADPAETLILPDLDTAETPAPTAARAAPARRFTWPPVGEMLADFYLAIAGALLLRLLIGLLAALRLWLTADPVSPLVAPEGNVRASQRIASPVTVGSGIVLPAGYAQWERSRLQMVLAHEQSHVRQMDFWLQMLAGLYTAAFWFSPLGWWLRRRLAQLAEAMGDRAGMDAAGCSSDYAQVVLEFASLPSRRLPGVAMASSGNLSRRIDALLNESRFRSAFADGRRRALASLLLIPAALFAATVLIRVPAASAQSVPQNPAPAPSTPGPSQPGPSGAPVGSAPVEPPPAAAAPIPSGPAQAGPQAVPLPPPPTDPAAPLVPPAQIQTAVPPAAPPQTAPLPPLPPVIVGDGQSVGAGTSESPIGSGTTVIMKRRDGSDSSDFDYHAMPDGNAWAVASGTWSDANLPSSLSASRRAEIERAHQTANGPFLWFTHDGKSYVVTDPAEVARIEGMYDAVDALRQGTLVELPDLSQVMAQSQAAMAKAQADINLQLSPQMMAQYQADIKAAQAQFTPERMAELQKQIEDSMKTAQQWLTPEKQAEMQKELAQAEKDLQKEQAQWNAKSQAAMQARMAEVQKRMAAAQTRIAEEQARWNSAEMKERMAEAQTRIAEAQKRAQARAAQRIDPQVERIIQQSLANGTAHPLQ